jgi:hypothetical protein
MKTTIEYILENEERLTIGDLIEYTRQYNI